MITYEFPVLRRIGFNQAVAQRAAMLPEEREGTLVRIVEVQRDRVTVHDGTAVREARVLPRLAQATIGDWAVLDEAGWLNALVEPVTQIARRANDGRRQLLASNVDTALLAMGLDLDFNPRRLERYIALVQACEVAPLVVLTKADCAPDADKKLALLRARLPPGVPLVPVDARSEAAVAALEPWLPPGQTLVLLGASGVGKSTLTNSLTQAGQDTGGVRRGDGRGRHTTTARSLHLCAGGACLIDTPGLRTWRPDADEEQLAQAFGDIAELARRCQFRDCAHGDEPGCAVRGAVDPDRLANYGKLLRDAARAAQTPLERIAERARWKVLGKAAVARNRDKRGA